MPAPPLTGAGIRYILEGLIGQHKEFRGEVKFLTGGHSPRTRDKAAAQNCRIAFAWAERVKFLHRRLKSGWKKRECCFDVEQL